jgi:hypothetical protein
VARVSELTTSVAETERRRIADESLAEAALRHRADKLEAALEDARVAARRNEVFTISCRFLLRPTSRRIAKTERLTFDTVYSLVNIERWRM